jgi:hypothetical protein
MGKVRMYFEGGKDPLVFLTRELSLTIVKIVLASQQGLCFVE